VPYRHGATLAPGVKLTFLDAGHVLGSAITVLDVSRTARRTGARLHGRSRPLRPPILRDPEVATDGATCCITESTYGDRNHDGTEKMEAQISPR
jgi:metallo-beta-lactamase family protein